MKRTLVTLSVLLLAFAFVSCDNSPKSFNVSFISHNEVYATQIVPVDGHAQKIQPEWDDVFETFDAWYADPLFTTPWDFENNIVTSDMTLYAKWNEIMVTISFLDKNGNPAHTMTIKGGTHGGYTPEAPEVEGYRFLGWFVERQDDPFEPTWVFYMDAVLQAKYEKIVPKVTVVAFGDTFTSEWNYGDVLPAGFFEDAPPGFAIDGWYTDPEFTTPYDKTQKLTGDITLYAKTHTIPTVTITVHDAAVDGWYTMNKGTTVVEDDFSNYIYGLSSMLSFQGWYADPGHSVPVVFPFVPEEDMDIYAKVVGVTVQVTLMNCGVPAPKMDARWGELMPVPSVTKEGCTIGGWYFDYDLTQPVDFDTYILKRSDLRIYANWIPN